MQPALGRNTLEAQPALQWSSAQPMQQCRIVSYRAVGASLANRPGKHTIGGRNVTPACSAAAQHPVQSHSSAPLLTACLKAQDFNIPGRWYRCILAGFGYTVFFYYFLIIVDRLGTSGTVVHPPKWDGLVL